MRAHASSIPRPPQLFPLSGSIPFTVTDVLPLSSMYIEADYVADLVYMVVGPFGFVSVSNMKKNSKYFTSYSLTNSSCRFCQVWNYNEK